MEQFDIEQQPGDPRNRLTGRARKLIGSGDKDGGLGRQLISLRKYSAAICLVEALAIVLLIYLLFKLPTAHYYDPTRFNQGLVSDTSSPPYRTYSDHLSSARLLLGLAHNCSQRKHDLAHSIRCHSHSAPGECAPVEQVQQVHNTMATTREASTTVLEVIETSRAGARLTKRREYAARKLIDTRATRVNTLAVVRRKRPRQRIIGWGGALSDSTINNVLSLTTNATRNLLDDYFGAQGLRFNLARVTIGGSDFSARFYTNNDANERARSVGDKDEDHFDPMQSNFKLMEEDQLYKIPMLKFIQSEYFQGGGGGGESTGERGPFKVFASMWSPPVWMKDNKHFNKGQLARYPPSGQNASSLGAMNALANLKIKWLEAYSRAGVDSLWGLTVMNEPVFAVQPFLNFNTMIFPREDYASYLSNHLGPRIRNHPQLGHLKIMVHDDNRRFLEDFTRPLLADGRVRPFIDGVSVHGYVDEEYGQMSALYRDYFKPTLRLGEQAADQSFFVLPTELCSGHLPFMDKALAGNWHRGVHYALDIIRSLQAMAAGWVDWNMALDMEGGPGWLGGRLDAPILVDRAGDTYHRSPMFYVLGHFSRYIPPGSRRLELAVKNAKYDKHYELVAFETPSQKLVIVVVNNNHYPVTLNWRISESAASDQQLADYESLLGGRTEKEFFVVTSPAESVQTIVYSL